MSYFNECPNCGAKNDPGETCACGAQVETSAAVAEVVETVDEGAEMIVLEQLPIIREQLVKIKADASGRVEAAMSLPCTDATVKEVKKVRAMLQKELTYWDEKRKFVKKSILEPYDAFEREFKLNISDVFNAGIKDLKEKIDSVENELKEAKKQNVKAYFDEYLESVGGVDFIDFDRSGIVILLSVSEKKLKEQAKEFIDGVLADVALIETQEHSDEILYEYKKSLKVGEAVIAVVERHRAIEEAEAQKAKAEAEALAKAEAAAKVDEVLKSEAFAPPVEEKVEAADLTSEKKYGVNFRVVDTLTKIKKLKEFMEKEGINYEQL